MRYVAAIPAKGPSALVAVVLAAGASLTWATASPAGSYQPPLEVVNVAKVVGVSPDASTTGSARCPDGYVATGGGVRLRADSPVMMEFDAVAPDGRGWEARGARTDDDPGATETYTVSAVCAKGTVTAMVQSSSTRRARRRHR